MQIFSSKFREFCAVGEYIEAFEDIFGGSRYDLKYCFRLVLLHWT